MPVKAKYVNGKIRHAVDNTAIHIMGNISLVCPSSIERERERERLWSNRRWLGGASWSEVSRSHSLFLRTEKK